MSLTQAQIESFLALGLGFAVAGLVTAVYRAFREEHPSFSLLLIGGPVSLAAIPLLAVAGPAIIMRNTMRGRRYEKRKVHFVAAATVLASLWSISIGYLVMNLL
jgi:hypothetical protein